MVIGRLLVPAEFVEPDLLPAYRVENINGQPFVYRVRTIRVSSVALPSASADDEGDGDEAEQQEQQQERIGFSIEVRSFTENRTGAGSSPITSVNQIWSPKLERDKQPTSSTASASHVAGGSSAGGPGEISRQVSTGSTASIGSTDTDRSPSNHAARRANAVAASPSSTSSSGQRYQVTGDGIDGAGAASSSSSGSTFDEQSLVPSLPVPTTEGQMARFVLDRETFSAPTWNSAMQQYDEWTAWVDRDQPQQQQQSSPQSPPALADAPDAIKGGSSVVSRVPDKAPVMPWMAKDAGKGSSIRERARQFARFDVVRQLFGKTWLVLLPEGVPTMVAPRVETIPLRFHVLNVTADDKRTRRLLMVPRGHVAPAEYKLAYAYIEQPLPELVESPFGQTIRWSTLWVPLAMAMANGVRAAPEHTITINGDLYYRCHQLLTVNRDDSDEHGFRLSIQWMAGPGILPQAVIPGQPAPSAGSAAGSGARGTGAGAGQGAAAGKGMRGKKQQQLLADDGGDDAAVDGGNAAAGDAGSDTDTEPLPRAVEGPIRKETASDGSLVVRAFNWDDLPASWRVEGQPWTKEKRFTTKHRAAMLATHFMAESTYGYKFAFVISQPRDNCPWNEALKITRKERDNE